MKSNTNHGSVNSSDPSLIYDSVVNYEYVNDASSTYETDEPDAETIADQKIHKIWKKIESTKEDLIRLQAIKDENVSEYLKSTDSLAETVSNPKTKLHFERNNQKTNVSIQLLQKKLEKYQHQVREIEEHGVQGSKTIIKVVQDHVRSGASSISDVVTKPLESFNNFIKKEKKSSSTDNVFNIDNNDEETERGFYHSIQSTSDEEHLSSGSTSNLITATLLENAIRNSYTPTENSDDDWDNLKYRLHKLEEENKEIKENVDYYQDGLTRVMLSLQEERYKTEQVQGILNDLFNQWNDLIELHQNEMMGVKEEMEHTLERIECVEYRFTERTAELHENVENCITRISKQEKQSQEQQQPIENYLNMDAKLLLSKFLSFIINICVVCICVITSLTRLVVPFVSNKVRLVTTGIAIISFIVLWQKADHELVSIFIFIFIMVQCVYLIIS